MEKNILFIGNPGSGKGTQAERLVKEFGFISISTGDLYRAELSKDNEWSEYFKELQKNSQLVDDATMNKFLLGNEDFMNSLRSGKFLFDGYPRSIGQAHFLKDTLTTEKIKLDCIFYLEVSQEICAQRLQTRYVCKKCKACYNSTLNELSSKKQDVCDSCGGELSKRFDDSSPEQIDKRMKEYDIKTDPLIDFYKGELITIDASLTPEKVYEAIKKHLL